VVHFAAAIYMDKCALTSCYATQWDIREHRPV
jgi:hypothetical protein